MPTAKKNWPGLNSFGGRSTNQLSAMPLVKAVVCVSKCLPSFLKNAGTIGLDDVA